MPGMERMGRIGNSEEMDTPPPNYPVKQHHTHGCSSLSFPQVASYLIIVSSLAIYWSCLVDSAPLICLILLEQVCLIGMVIGASLATFSDPTDRVIYSYKWAQFDSNIKYNLKYEQVMYCEYCDSYCHKDSKHCRSCNRCVDGFDHHCIWFNNCVGGRNYRAFFMSIIFTFSYSCIFVGHTLYASLNEDYPSGLKRMIPAWIIGAVLSVFAFLLANLIFLHLYLINAGQTTYSFLTRQKKEEEQRAKKEALKDSNRSEGNLIFQKDKKKTTLTIRELQVVKVARAENNSRNEPAEDNQIRAVELHESQNDPNEVTIQSDCNDKKQEEDTAVPYLLRNNRSLRLLLNQTKTGESASSPKRRRKEYQ